MNGNDMTAVTEHETEGQVVGVQGFVAEKVVQHDVQGFPSWTSATELLGIWAKNDPRVAHALSGIFSAIFQRYLDADIHNVMVCHDLNGGESLRDALTVVSRAKTGKTSVRRSDIEFGVPNYAVEKAAVYDVEGVPFMAIRDRIGDQRHTYVYTPVTVPAAQLRPGPEAMPDPEDTASGPGLPGPDA